MGIDLLSNISANPFIRHFVLYKTLISKSREHVLDYFECVQRTRRKQQSKRNGQQVSSLYIAKVHKIRIT